VVIVNMLGFVLFTYFSQELLRSPSFLTHLITNNATAIKGRDTR